LRRLLEIRVPELIAYQDAAYARQYTDFVARVAREEADKTPGRTGLSEAVARNLFKLMAYKDEYEVARLHLGAALQAELHARFGPAVRYYWHLHPPLLRALGLKRKIRLGAWFKPAFSALSSMKGLRGTAFDVFGYARVRREERALIGEYRALIERALAALAPGRHDARRGFAVPSRPGRAEGQRGAAGRAGHPDRAGRGRPDRDSGQGPSPGGEGSAHPWRGQVRPARLRVRGRALQSHGEEARPAQSRGLACGRPAEPRRGGRRYGKPRRHHPGGDAQVRSAGLPLR